MIRFFDNSIFSEPGSPVKEVYSPKVNKDGTIELVVTGYENTDDFIQSFAESTDMEYIISQLRAGDLSVLNSRPGSYGDFTQVPKTFAEALQLQIDSANLFNSLPVDIRQLFDHDQNKFFAQSGTKEWYEKISPVLPDEVKSVIFPVSEVKEDVQE